VSPPIQRQREPEARLYASYIPIHVHRQLNGLQCWEGSCVVLRNIALRSVTMHDARPQGDRTLGQLSKPASSVNFHQWLERLTAVVAVTRAKGSRNMSPQATMRELRGPLPRPRIRQQPRRSLRGTAELQAVPAVRHSSRNSN